MHGLFDLVDGVSERDFTVAFDAFADDLEAKQLAIGRKIMRRLPHEGYDASPPRTAYLVAIEFSSVDQAERCWAYVERHEEPVTSLHRLVNMKIQNSAFYLLEDVLEAP